MYAACLEYPAMVRPPLTAAFIARFQQWKQMQIEFTTDSKIARVPITSGLYLETTNITQCFPLFLFQIMQERGKYFVAQSTQHSGLGNVVTNAL